MNYKRFPIKKNGIANNIPDVMKYFSQSNISQTIDISDYLPDIKEVISIIITPRVTSIKTVRNVAGKSFEGENISSCQLLLEIEITQRIMYVTDDVQQSMHVIQNTSMAIVYIDVSPLIEGTETELLVKHEKFKTNVFTQDVVINRINSRKVHSTCFLISEVRYIPTYEICLCEYHNSKGSYLGICYDDGKYYKKLTEEYLLKVILPTWSPGGQDIAFLSNREGGYMLYILNINNDIPVRITDPMIFESITSYCWNNNGDKIYFSATKDNEKDIYSIDVRGLNYERLTYGEDLGKNYKPICSHNGEKIAFTRSSLDEKRLYIMENNGLGLKQLTSFGKVKDYDWSLNDKNIAYIIDEKLGEYNLYVININTYEREFIKIPDKLVKLRKLRYSPKGNYITYIGRKEIIDNIYLYDIKTRVTINLTRKIGNKTIRDYVWKIDEKKIYYSANYIDHFKVYILDIEKGNVVQMTDNAYLDVNLSYRPKII
ncbi:TolB family protein [Wukongibacter sp. M2B1]|uniref:TolB family protein n=1 Tax=Wukongibacter sp. M2B1 TaxID=3088895 RepID=UPI003D7A3F13